MGKSSVGAASAGAGGTDMNRAIQLADPQAALDQFQKAAQAIEDSYPGAFDAFQKYVSGGSKGALDQNTQAQLANLPVSSAATAALDELRGFMGLPGISPTAGLSASVNGLAAQLANDPNSAQQKVQLEGIRDQLNQAENIKDPAAREQAKQQITQQLSDFTAGLGPEHQNLATQMQGIQNQFNVGYGQDAASAWSPEVMQAKLEATPGYQFRMNQGMQALERSAAARGGLLSGNTLAATQEYAQGLAAQEYDKHINRLQQTVGQTIGGINQQTGLLQGAGDRIAGTGDKLGAAAGDIEKGIGEAQQQAGILAGQTEADAARNQAELEAQGQQTNAQLQNQTNIVNAQLQQQANLANQQASGTNAGMISQLLNATR